MNIAINGFGRIGRQTFKLAMENPNVNIVAINDIAPIDILAQLLRYDSVYGFYDKDITVVLNGIEYTNINELTEIRKETGVLSGEIYLGVDDCNIRVFSESLQENLPWKDLSVDVVIESTGLFTKNKDAEGHIKAGAKKVVISAPSKGDQKADTFLIGVNEETYKGQLIVSNASCTTNCVGPVTAIIEGAFGIKKAGLTTIHSYTSSQSLVDGFSKNALKDLRRARNASQNIIPTTTGAAVSTTEVISSLKGKFDGCSLRVPVAVGSITDFTFLLNKKTTVEEVRNLFIKMSEDPKYEEVLEVTDDPIVSSDIIGSTASAIVDLNLIQVIDGDLLKIFAWYDNEMGYSARLIDMALNIDKK